jgi:pyranose oxidase
MEAQHGDIRSTPKTLQTDVLIVGSGPIGATYARTIINEDANIKVLMVEMGEQ